jgi:HEPN domain-containing protein
MPQPEHQRMVREWFLRADDDRQEAQVLAREDPESPNSVWLVQQQAVEKALKSILLLHRIGCRKIHDLEKRRELMPSQYRLKTVPKDLTVRSQRGMESRYPGEYDPIDQKDVKRALRAGTKVMELLNKEFDPRVRYRIDPITGIPFK